MDIIFLILGILVLFSWAVNSGEDNREKVKKELDNEKVIG